MELRIPIVAIDASVMFTDPMRPLFEVVGSDVGRSAHAIAAIFHYEFSVDMWSGHVTEEQFWPRFAERVGAMTISPGWRSTVLNGTRPLPALRSLPALAQRCEIWLVANHRHEWLNPVLHTSGAVCHLDRKVVSSRSGLMQPQPAAYQHLRRLTHTRPVLFVGSNAVRTAGARAAGMDAIIADSNWQLAVQQWHDAKSYRIAELSSRR